MLKVTFTQQHADAVRADMRALLKLSFGMIDGTRAPIPLYDLLDGRFVLDFVSDTTPKICDPRGEECVVAKLPIGSLVRVRGFYETKARPGLMPVMTAIQIGNLAVTSGPKLFESLEI